MTEEIVAHIDLNARYVVLNNGETYPITNLFDDEGDELVLDELADGAIATAAVCGQDGYWFILQLAGFAPPTWH